METLYSFKGVSAWMNQAPQGASIVLPRPNVASSIPPLNHGSIEAIGKRKGLLVKTTAVIVAHVTNPADTTRGVMITIIDRSKFKKPRKSTGRPKGSKNKKRIVKGDGE